MNRNKTPPEFSEQSMIGKEMPGRGFNVTGLLSDKHWRSKYSNLCNIMLKVRPFQAMTNEIWLLQQHSQHVCQLLIFFANIEMTTPHESQIFRILGNRIRYVSSVDTCLKYLLTYNCFIFLNIFFPRKDKTIA